MASAAALRTSSFTLVSSERAPSAIFDAPAWAKALEIERPMPLDAPTMKTALFSGAIDSEEMAG